MSDDDKNIDRREIRRMVEDKWRRLMLSARDINRQYPNDVPAAQAAATKSAQDSMLGFKRRCQSIASLMPPEQAKLFMQTVEEEDDACAKDCAADKAAFYRRLGIDET